MKYAISKNGARMHWLITMAFAFLLVIAVSASAAAQPDDFPRSPRGEEAISALADRLPDVAAAYGMSAQELSDLFRNDQSLSVNRNGELYYVDVALSDDGHRTTIESSQPVNGPFPNDQTFLLESLPGANHTIYLDFDGHTTSGTSWAGGGTIVSPPYDLDGNPSTWSQSELDRIQRVWQIVAEDFSPFAVNVTTKDPGTAALSRSGGGDTTWGSRVVITGDDWDNCGCGGFAYLGSFDDSVDEPVFVFNGSEAGIAEASSHEVGHAMLLSHDGYSGGAYYWGHGSGETSWAPLMGASYNVNVSQWSRGEYYSANNGEDDLAIIASLSNGNGFGYRADDVGNNNSTAQGLTLSGNSVSGNGIVERNTDIDVFEFTTGSGVVAIDIVPDSIQPNLDIVAQLYDATNNLIATSNSATSVSASFNETLSAGTYYLHIDGTGTGTPLSNPPTGYTQYGSIGQYTISGTIVDPGTGQPPVAVASADPTTVMLSLAVDFSSVSSNDPDGTIVSYTWDFGDGNMSNLANPSHTYASDGTFLATLTVVDNDGFSDNDSVSITVTPPPPAAPTNLNAASLSETQIDLNWDDNSGNETGFRIERSTGGGGFSEIATVGANVTTYSNTGLQASSTYDYRVLAYNGSGSSGYSNVASATTDDPPTFEDIVANGEIASAGSVNGSYVATQTDGNGAEAITERQSGGKPANRHSYLEHTWTFDVTPGVSLLVMANTWAPANSENDSFLFEWSSNNTTYTPMFSADIASSDPDTYQSFALPSTLNGTVYIRVTDTDQTSGNRNLDTVTVDHLFIRKQNTQGDPPVAPDALQATAVSASQIDLIWTSAATDEFGYYVDRSTDGVSFTKVATLGVDETSYSDTGLSAAATYYYQVRAYNGSGASDPSNTASATTQSAPEIHVADLDASTSTSRNRWNAIVTILIVDADDNPIISANVTGTWSGGATGSASCLTDNDGTCQVSKNNLKSNVSSVTFTVLDVSADGYVYAPGQNDDADGDSNGSVITVLKP
jgi:PKD repeat protein